MKEGKYIPLPNVEADRLHVNLPLPGYIDAERIGINVPHMQRLCRLGGISHLAIHASSLFQRGTDAVMITGFTQKGEAYAAKGKSAHKNIFDAKSEHTDRTIEGQYYRFKNDRWIATELTIDTEQIANNIVTNKKIKEGVRSEKAWSREINAAIKQGIVNEGTKHLLLDINQGEMILSSVVNYFILANLIDADPIFFDFMATLPPTPENIGWAASTVVANKLIQRGLYRQIGEEGRRFSIMFGPEADRAGVLYVASKTQPLVKAIKK
jgi:hypothetical protein